MSKQDHQQYADYLHSFKSEPINLFDIRTGEMLEREEV